MSLNIYISGPDATRKTTMAHMLRDFLGDQMGKEAVVQSFPSEVGAATGLIRLHLN